MKTQSLGIILTVINLVLLVFNLAQPGSAGAGGTAPVLRGRALEIVDSQGRVRASINVHPADQTVKMPDGSTGYPETVLLRLIDANGRPEVKLGASENGGALGLVGAYDTTHLLLQAKGAETLIKLSNKDGRQQLLKP